MKMVTIVGATKEDIVKDMDSIKRAIDRGEMWGQTETGTWSIIDSE